MLLKTVALGFRLRFLTCLGLVGPPGEEAILGNRLFGLVVRLAAETADTVQTAATEE
jgi:hypothetical protein